ncbi:cystin-1 [Eudromia elegans]
MGSGSSRRRGRGATAATAATAATPAAAADRELLETVLAECEEAAAPPLLLVIPMKMPTETSLRGVAGAWERALLLTDPVAEASLSRSPPDPGNNNVDDECSQDNNKQPEGQSTISYDCSEEELMASIEREYGR